MDYTLQNAYQQAMSRNDIYNRNIANYQFLYDSYTGGEAYKNGNYLTQYQLESAGEYAQRLHTTPVDNHCRSIISTYISFMFRVPPQRELGGMELDPAVEEFLRDADWDGRSLDAFMKDAAIWANVFGHAWAMVCKPYMGAVTRADELAQNVRPYLNLLTPLVVTDWHYTRRMNGSYQLSYFKYVEDVNGNVTTIREWTPEEIVTTIVDTDKETVKNVEVEVNGLGQIPAVCIYAHKSSIRGQGISSIQDIASHQKFIFNMTSEVEQAVRLGSHPSLVKTKDTMASNGAGSIIEMPENLDPALVPYVLEFSGAEISSMYNAIDHSVDAIDKMANTGSIRATETRVMSGVAREVEFALLNARLSEQADNLELAEEQIWEFVAAYQGQIWTGNIDYPDSFAIRDTQNELDQLVKARAATEDPAARRLIEHEILELVGIELEDDAAETEMATHTMTNLETGESIEVETEQQHQQALAQGFTA